ncbi:MAG TPA: SpoIIE family protein phosphatase [Thermoanaerobaculia bacterium]|nr:SpoIIE family protein phosphatase [Thermoanaerobaculia bacterium]
MRIRTRLILAFLLLSVVPLTGIVLYSYLSSQKAVRAAQQLEAEEMARQMDRRVADVRKEVGERVARLGDLPLGRLVQEAGGDGITDPVAAQIVAEIGDAAPFVESIEFMPADLGPPREAEMLAEASSEAPRPPGVPRSSPVAPAPPTPAPAGTGVVVPSPPTPPVPPVIVIDVDEILREVAETLERQGIAGSEAMGEGSGGERIGEAAAKIASARVGLSEEELRKFEQQMEQFSREMEAWGSEVAKRGQVVVEEAAEREAERTARVLTRVREKAEQIRASDRAPADSAAASPAPRATVRPRLESEQGPDQTRILFGRELQLPVRREGEVVGEIRPRIRAGMLIRSILSMHDRASDEIPFALDSEGNLHAPDEPSRETIQALGLAAPATEARSQRVLRNWVVATSKDEESGLTLGILRPIREPLAEVRRAAGRNFAYGLGLVFVALIGILPLANHMSRDVEMVTEGAERIAQGDLETEVPVRGAGELGTLAVAFNRMARDLREQQSRLLEQERLRKEQEIQRRLLAAEFERKSEELEQARQFQISLLPKALPRVEGLSLAVHMKTATEVGGDYYDFLVGGASGPLTVALGDATGHGASAGTMVTIVKSLFSTYSGERPPGVFLGEAGETVRKMDLGRMAMALLLARFSGTTLTLAAAGMPPALLYRARTRKVEELAAVGMPLGSFDGEYREVETGLESGDTILLMSDGFPELADRRGEPLGYVAVENAFRVVASASPEEIIAALARAADERTGGQPPDDDITFVVVKVEPTARLA